MLTWSLLLKTLRWNVGHFRCSNTCDNKIELASFIRLIIRKCKFKIILELNIVKYLE